MSKTQNYSYIGITFIILVFGIIFVPRIVNRITSGKVIENDGGRTKNVSTTVTDNTPLLYITQNGQRRKAPNFSFTNQNGKTITNKDYEGKVYLVEFFFTSCPTICPRMSRNLVNIQDSFKSFNNFGIASFSINPTYDTPEVLKDYAAQYKITNPNWHLMTGNIETIYKLANQGFYLTAEQDDAEEGGFLHSGNFALIDKKGFIRSRVDAYGNPKIYYRGIISEEEAYQEQEDENGIRIETEEISILKQDIAKLLKE